MTRARGCRPVAPQHPQPYGACRLLEGAKNAFFLTPSCFAWESGGSANPLRLVAGLRLVEGGWEGFELQQSHPMPQSHARCLQTGRWEAK